jgi:hypothetical protein
MGMQDSITDFKFLPTHIRSEIRGWLCARAQYTYLPACARYAKKQCARASPTIGCANFPFGPIRLIGMRGGFFCLKQKYTLTLPMSHLRQKTLYCTMYSILV